MSEVSVNLAARFFRNVPVSEHDIGCIAEHEPLAQQAGRAMRTWWEHPWWPESAVHRRAREIMGGTRFCPPTLLSEFFGFEYDADRFKDVPFSADRLKRAQAESFVLIADPGVSIREMCEFKPDKFVYQHYRSTARIAGEKESPSWILVSNKGNWNRRDFHGQDELRRQQGLALPSARQVVLLALLERVLFGAVVFSGVALRTSNVTDWLGEEKRVAVGNNRHGKEGISLDVCKDGVVGEGIGMALGMESEGEQLQLGCC